MPREVGIHALGDKGPRRALRGKVSFRALCAYIVVTVLASVDADGSSFGTRFDRHIPVGLQVQDLALHSHQFF